MATMWNEPLLCFHIWAVPIDSSRVQYRRHKNWRHNDCAHKRNDLRVKSKWSYCEYGKINICVTIWPLLWNQATKQFHYEPSRWIHNEWNILNSTRWNWYCIFSKALKGDTLKYTEETLLFLGTARQKKVFPHQKDAVK